MGIGGATGTGALGGGGLDQGSGGLIGGEIPKGGGGRDTDASCAGLVLEPEAITVVKETTVELNCTSEAPQPISIYLVLDNSQSMEDGSRWEDAVGAIESFVESNPNQAAKPWTCVDKEGKSAPPPSSLPKAPTPGDVSVAIQYFHPVGNQGDECNGTGHRTPAVAMNPIPANAGAITSSLGSTGPTGNTPTVGALTGGTQYCADYQNTNPDVKCVLVLVTDGQPNGCGLSSRCNGQECVDPDAPGMLTPIAGNAFTAQNSVVTFTVGMDGVTTEGFGLLNQIAVAGGSDCTPNTPGNEACNVTTGGSQAFLDALNTIRKSVQVTSTSNQTVTTTTTETTTLQCEWSIPKPSDGQKFDKDLVNVAVTVTGVKHQIGNVPDLAACAATGGGWYYDDPAAPTKILSCPTTCSTIQASADTKVEVQVGCATERADPR